MPETPGRSRVEISRDEVAHLAMLARIELSDAELDHLAPQLSVILESVASLSDVDLTDVPPMSHALPLTNVFRDDVVTPSLLDALRRGSPAVLDLLEVNPFPEAPPTHLRWRLYRYRFTDAAERAATGHWWVREPVTTSDSG